MSRIFMPTYTVHVTIENKPGIADPEGSTILNDLVFEGKLFFCQPGSNRKNAQIYNK